MHAGGLPTPLEAARLFAIILQYFLFCCRDGTAGDRKPPSPHSMLVGRPRGLARQFSGKQMITNIEWGEGGGCALLKERRFVAGCTVGNHSCVYHAHAIAKIKNFFLFLHYIGFRAILIDFNWFWMKKDSKTLCL
jgi:hypothetical protein